MVLRGRFRQYWKSWLALSVLVALAGGFVLASAAAGRRTAAALPGFTARHGYDVIVYSGTAAAAAGPAAARRGGDASTSDFRRHPGLRVLPETDRSREHPDQ